MTFSEIKTARPEWSDKVALEAWLKDCDREGMDVADAFGINLDINGEADLTDEQVAFLLTVAP
jgi:hypothetical protein